MLVISASTTGRKIEFQWVELSTSSSGTDEFQGWNSRLPGLELVSSTPGIFWNSTPLLSLRHHKNFIISIKTQVYNQINLLQKASISKNLLQDNKLQHIKLQPFAVDSVHFFMFLSRAGARKINTTRFLSAAKLGRRFEIYILLCDLLYSLSKIIRTHTRVPYINDMYRIR